MLHLLDGRTVQEISLQLIQLRWTWITAKAREMLHYVINTLHRRPGTQKRTQVFIMEE